jgi:hypothetical protein
MNMQNLRKPRIFILTTVMLITLIGGSIMIYRARAAQELRERQNRQLASEDPGDIVEAFIDALRTGDIAFAKELLVPDQRQHLDEWIVTSHHVAFECPGSPYWFDFNSIVSSGGTGYGHGDGDIRDEIVDADSGYYCNFSESSIEIESALVQYDAPFWKITGWDSICVSAPEKDSPKLCYH